MRLYWDTLGMNKKGSEISVVIRVEFIKNHSDESQWHYISSKQNPADYAPRETDVVMMIKLKGGILDQSFFWNQRQLGMTTK